MTKIKYNRWMKSTGELTLEVMKSAGWYNKWLYSLIKPYLSGEILEVGAGIGNFSELLSQSGEVTAIDYDNKYIKLLKNKFGKKINSGVGDIEKGKYFFKKRYFDTIVCMNVLEHIENDERALQNIYNLLKKDGILVLLVPAHMVLYSNFDKEIGHFRRYSLKDLKSVLKRSGFNIQKIRYINWLAAIGWYFSLKVSREKHLPGGEVKIFNYLGKVFLWPEKFVNLPFGLSVLAIVKK